MPYTDKKILITGAGGTIGSEIARVLSAASRKITLHCHKKIDRANALKSEIEKLGAECFVVSADISKISKAMSLVAEASEKMGGLDLFIHSAALFERTPLGEVTEDEWDRIINLDLKSAFFIAQEAGILMQRKGGKMIFLSDVAGVKPYAGYLPYCIAKAGIDALVKGLAKSLAPKIEVNAIAPYIVTRPDGLSDSGWNDLLSKMPMRRPQTPHEIAAIVKTLADECTSITGQIITVDGGRLLR